MKTTVVFLVFKLVMCFTLLSSISSIPGQTMNNKTVLEMVEKGVSTALIIEAIRLAPDTNFTFTVDDYAAFTQAKIGPEIIRAMSESQRQKHSLPASKQVAPAPNAKSTTSSQEQNLPRPTKSWAELTPLTPGQPEVGGSLTVTRFGSLTTKIGGSVNTGVTLHPYVSLVGDYNFSRMGKVSGCVYGACASARVNSHTVLLGPRFNLMPNSRVIPYATAELGIFRGVIGANVNSSDISGSITEDVTKFAYSVGGGVLIRAAQHVDVFVDIKGIKGNELVWLQRAAIGANYRF